MESRRNGPQLSSRHDDDDDDVRPAYFVQWLCPSKKILHPVVDVVGHL